MAGKVLCSARAAVGARMVGAFFCCAVDDHARPEGGGVSRRLNPLTDQQQSKANALTQRSHPDERSAHHPPVKKSKQSNNKKKAAIYDSIYIYIYLKSFFLLYTANFAFVLYTANGGQKPSVPPRLQGNFGSICA